MPRPKNVIPTIEKTVSLPEDLVVAVDLELFSELEGKVPFGAWKGFLTRLVKEHLDRQQRAVKLAVNMKAAADNYGPETGHLKMDALMVEYLTATGAYEAARIFITKEKWYA